MIANNHLMMITQTRRTDTQGTRKQPCKVVQQLDAQTRTMSETAVLRSVYDKLLGSLRLAQASSSSSSILITSANFFEGSTTVASNLAVAASLAGFSVLLVAGHSGKAEPQCANAIGFTDVLTGSFTADQACFTSAFPKEGLLRVMLPGTARPTLLRSIDWTKAKETFKSFSRDFDMTVIDAQPILSSSDALLLASLVDGVLLVVDSSSSHRDSVRRARDLLQQVNTPIVGAVLNRTDTVARAGSAPDEHWG